MSKPIINQIKELRINIEKIHDKKRSLDMEIELIKSQERILLNELEYENRSLIGKKAICEVDSGNVVGTCTGIRIGDNFEVLPNFNKSQNNKRINYISYKFI